MKLLCKQCLPKEENCETNEHTHNFCAIFGMV